MKFLLAGLLGLFLLLSGAAEAKAPPLKIVTTFSILGEMAQRVGGDDAVVTTLVGTDGDVHVYKPTPQDSKNMAEADIFIENGLGLEPWADRLVKASGFKGKRIVASAGITSRRMEIEDAAHGHGGKIDDPHAWQDVKNADRYVRTILDGLVVARPDMRPAYHARAATYSIELGDLDLWIKKEFLSIPKGQRKIITSHDAFGYYGKAYDISFLAPQGISTEAEPTAAQVAKLVEQMKAEKVKRVFFENMASPRLIRQLAKDVGADVEQPVYSDALSGADGPAAAYVAMMRHNTALFKEAMSMNGK